MDSLFQYASTNAAWAAALALVAAVGSRLCRRWPAVGHVLWLLVLLKLLLPSFLQLPAGHDPQPERPSVVVAPVVSLAPAAPQKPTAPAAARQRDSNSKTRSPRPREPLSQPSPSRSWPWKPVVFGIWLAGAGLWGALLLGNVRRFHRLIRHARPAEAELAQRIGRIAGRLGLRAAPAARLLSARVPPMVWAPLVGPAWLVLPEELWGRLEDAQRDAILVHELAHLRRRDQWVRRVQALACGLYWWNPVSWWAARELERAEEQCCDAWVLWALPTAAAAYAEALVKTVAFLSKIKNPLPAGACGVGRVIPLKRRLQMILAEDRISPAARIAPRALVASGMFALVLLPALASEPGTPRIGAVSDPPALGQEGLQKAPVNDDAPSAKSQPKPIDVLKQEVRKDDGPSAKPAVPKVRVAHPLAREITDHLNYNGMIVAGREVVLKPRVSGMIVSVLCRTGQVVKAGEPLFELDSRPLKAELDRAQAECDRATARRNRKKTEFQNTERLAAGNSVSRTELSLFEAELLEAQASLKAAEAAREVARLNLEFTRVTAPFAGTITGPVLSTGNVASADTTTLATLIAIDPVHVEFRVDQYTILALNRLTREGKLQDLSPLQVSLPSETGTLLKAKLESTDIRLDPGTGTARWRAEIANPDHLLLPGMGVIVRMTTSAPYKALLVPLSAFVRDASRRHFVSVLTRGHAVVDREVKRGQDQDDGLVTVIEGLTADDWVVLDRPAWSQMPEKVEPETVPINEPAKETVPNRR